MQSGPVVRIWDNLREENGTDEGLTQELELLPSCRDDDDSLVWIYVRTGGLPISYLFVNVTLDRENIFNEYW